MRIWLCCLLLSVFTFQVIPVKAIGKALVKTWSAGEDDSSEDSLPDGDGPLKLKKDFETEKMWFNNSFVPSTAIIISQVRTSTALIASSNIPLQFVPDVVTPPPDRA